MSVDYILQGNKWKHIRLESLCTFDIFDSYPLPGCIVLIFSGDIPVRFPAIPIVHFAVPTALAYSCYV